MEDLSTINPAFQGIYKAAKPVTQPTPQVATPQPTNSQSVVLNDGTQLDGGVVKVLRSIRGLETQGSQSPYTQPGDIVNGQATSSGAFQWNNDKQPLSAGQIPSHFQNDASQYGLDPNDFSPANQNKVAYAKIANQKAQGLTPIEIDALWNGAHKDPTTGKYVHNNPERAAAFQNALAQEMQSNPTQAQPTQSQTDAPPSVGGFLGNAVQSGANFLGNIGEAVLHPVQTLQNVGGSAVGGLQELGGQTNENTARFDNLKNYFVQRYGGISNIEHALYTDPVGVLADVSAALGVGGGVAGALGKIGELSRISELSDISKVSSIAKGTQEALNTASKFTNPLTPVVSGASAALNKFGNPLKTAASVATNISREGIDTILKNPGKFTPEQITNYSQADLTNEIYSTLKTKEANISETGSEYTPFRQSSQYAEVAPDFLAKNIEKATGAIVDQDGTVIPGGRINTPQEVRAVQSFYDTWQPKVESGDITPDEFLNMRTHANVKLAKFGRELTKDKNLQAVGSDIYTELNRTLRPKFPGLEKLDSKMSTQKKTIQELTEGLFDKKGNLLKTAKNRINRAGNRGQEQMLAQLEKIIPGVTGRLEIQNAMEEIIKAGETKSGAITKRLLPEGALALVGASTGSIKLIAGAITAAIITDPRVAVPLIRAFGSNKNLIHAVTVQLAKSANLPTVVLNRASSSGGQETSGLPTQVQEPTPQEANTTTETPQ